MNRCWLWVVMIGVFASGLYASGPFTVTRMTENELILQFTLPLFTIVDVEQNGTTYQRIDCQGSVCNGEAGFPQTPGFTETIGLPPNGSMSVEILDEKHRLTNDVRLLPLAEPSEGDDVIRVQNPIAYSRRGLLPADAVSLNPSAYLRDRMFQSFCLNAFQYNPSTHGLRVLTSATIRVRINGNFTAIRSIPRGNILDAVGADFCVNDQYARHWRKPVEPSNETATITRDVINEIQLDVVKRGIYKITYSMLRDSMTVWQDSLGYQFGFDLDTVDPRNFEVQDENGVIPIRFVGEADGVFDRGDYFEFYGDRHYGDQGYEDDISEVNVYRLIYTPNQLGARMAVENGGLEVNDASEFTVPVAYKDTKHFEQQSIFSRLGGGVQREDLYFWKSIQAPDLEIVPITLEYPYASASRYFDAKAVLYGSTHFEPPVYPANVYDHHAQVRVNSALVDDMYWYYQSECVFEKNGELPNSDLVNGTNQLYVSLPGDTPYSDREGIWLDNFEITYWREYKTSIDEMRFTKPQDRPAELFQYELDNFSSPDVSVYKLGSSFMVNLQVEPFTQSGGAPYKVVFQDYTLSDNTYYYAVTEAQKQKPVRMRPNLPSALRSPTNYANYVIITSRTLADCEGTQLLKSTWESRGAEFYGSPITVKVVDVQDIYDEFNHGIASSESIRDFLIFAYNNWNNAAVTGSSELTHVLLLGEGTQDYRYNSTSTKYNIIPIHTVWTEKLGATTSDNWYGCVVGDDPVADLSIGRINTWKPEQVLQSVQKVIYYMDNPDYESLWQSHIGLSAGGKLDDVTDVFSQQSEALRKKWIPTTYDVTRIYCTTQTVAPEYFGRNSTLMEKINAGLSFLVFLGHGGGQIWADYGLFHYYQVPSLINTRYPFVVSMACYCGAFDSPGSACLGEALVMAPDKGAIGHVGFSGLGYLDWDPYFAEYITRALYKENIHNMGDVLSYTKAMFYTNHGGAPGYALTSSSILSGDPMIWLWMADEPISMNIDDNTLASGDTLRITATFPGTVDAAKLILTDSDEIVLNYPYSVPTSGNQVSFEYKLGTAFTNSGEYFAKVHGYGPNANYTGQVSFGVGISVFSDIELQPAVITNSDSVYVYARVADEDSLTSIKCIWQRSSASDEVNKYPIAMVYDQTTGKYRTRQGIPPAAAGQRIYYYFQTTDIHNTVTSSTFKNYVVTGADLKVISMTMTEEAGQPAIRVQAQNSGSTTSPEFSVDCYWVPSDSSRIVLVGSTTGLPLASMTQEFINVPIDPLRGNVTLRVILNRDHTIPEVYYSNNTRDGLFSLNMFSLTPGNSTMNSLDGNVTCEMPTVFPSGTIAYLGDAGSLTPDTQPSLYSITMAYPDADSVSMLSPAYEIGVLNSNLLADSLGTLPGNGKMRVKFRYDKTRTTLPGEVSLYRWSADYKKWIYQGRNVVADSASLVMDITRIGTYAIFGNSDHIAPIIDANVEAQEFTHGGYISGTGIISLIFSDTDGIDVVDHTPQLFLDGQVLSSDLYTMAVGSGNLLQVPIKYQLDLDQGEYTLLVGCTDVNGNYGEQTIRFKVNNEFSIINLANYPNPIKSKTVEAVNEGRTRFTYVLTDNADKVTLKIYTVSGRLVKTFENLPSAVGYHEYPRTLYGWDCCDEDGFELANGVYFYRLTATRDGKKIEKTQKMAILK
jgi:hypothetical protein